MIVYVDTSAALKLVVEEEESAAAADYLHRAGAGGDRLVASLLLHTEMHCAARRRPDQVDPHAVRQALSAIDLFDLERGDLLTAAAVPGTLRTFDAVHLAAALRISADAIVVYDVDLAQAAEESGLRVVSPS